MSTEAHAEYACDACRSRKVSCTRELPVCSRCKAIGGITCPEDATWTCSYSRSGVLRRNRKRKAAISTNTTSGSTRSSPYGQPASSSTPVQAAVTDRLQRLIGRDHASLKDLASLMSEYHSVWQDSSVFDTLAEHAKTYYNAFEEYLGRRWADATTAALEQDRMAVGLVPPDVLADLIASNRLERIRDRAWLVIFYSIALRSLDEATIHWEMALESNLWLAFNDVRLFLEPSALNIQALITLVTYPERNLSPYACWSITSKASTMLLALGVGTHAPVDPTVKKQRDVLFWRLNTLDKTLALILSRSPVLQRELTKSISPPTLEELLYDRPRYPTAGMPVLFKAHYDQQMNLLSRIKVDVWHCLPGQETHNVENVRNELDSWYAEAKKVLEASSLVEKPLLSDAGHAYIDLCLQTLLFNVYYLMVLLTIASKDMRPQSVHPAQKLLGLLPHLGELIKQGTREPSGVLLWEWLHYPMMAFGTLWGQVLSRGVADHDESERILDLLNNVPNFLSKLEQRHTIAGKLKGITEKIIQHVRAIHRSSVHENLAAANTQIAIEPPFDIPTTSTDTTFDTPLNGMLPLPDEFFLDPTFDWFSWGDQLLS